ncbi:hypothetical protein [Pseudonocardia sp. ICBG601]|uniref:hypothetical protein n=1 Tax=Pseudonocardia sp. ICBG601 TaxID=2846759 RepID=UPI001CF6190B|nr:hypothetical protein [Pseudonocardia sp. ICBG601]
MSAQGSGPRVPGCFHLLACRSPPGNLVGHARRIRLEHWQRDIVDAHPDRFLRGMFPSDGCRTTNRVRSRRPDGSVRGYADPRRFLGATPDDIVRLAEAAPDRTGIAHRRAPRDLAVGRAR